MKKVYFVRHGETDGNREQTFQDGLIPLSEKGRAQAAIVGERFKTIPINSIIASPMKRAHETAHAIAQTTGCVVLESEFFQEVQRPSVVHGKHWDDSSISDIVTHFRRSFKEEGNKHSDEENFFDLRARGIAALRFIESRTEDTVCVVTHGTFLKMLLAVMMRGEKTTFDFFDSIDRFHFPQNTGISKCEFGRFKEGEWILTAWNDDAHLGEIKGF